MPANAIELLLLLFLLHFLLDFPLQPSHWIAERNQKKAASPRLYLHAISHGLATTLCFAWLTGNLILTLSAGAIVLVSHFLTDLGKACWTNGGLKAFLLDQFLHWLVLLGVWGAYVGTEPLLALLSTPSASLLIILLAYLLVMLPMSVLVSLCLTPWITQLQQQDDSEESLTKAGAMIGYLERVLILTFMLLGEYTAIGFVMAFKAAFRFKEAEQRTKAEYMMMGTFLSFALTIGVGLGALYLLELAKH